jgi:hypothetical protein
VQRVHGSASAPEEEMEVSERTIRCLWGLGYRYKRPRAPPPGARQKRAQARLEGASTLRHDGMIMTETPAPPGSLGTHGGESRCPHHRSVALFCCMALRIGTKTSSKLCCARYAFGGWHIVLFIDRGSPHKAKQGQRLAREIGIQLRTFLLLSLFILFNNMDTIPTFEVLSTDSLSGQARLSITRL